MSIKRLRSSFAARAPATLPPVRSGSVAPTVPVPRSGDPTASPAALRSVAAAVRAPATQPPFLPPFRSGGAVPTVVPTPQRVDLPLALRTLRRPYRRSAPAVRRRPSSRHRGAEICRCRCARSVDPAALPLRRRGANRRPDAAARLSAAAGALRLPLPLLSLTYASGCLCPWRQPRPRLDAARKGIARASTVRVHTIHAQAVRICAVRVRAS